MVESEARCNCCFLRPAPREAKLDRRTTRISHDSKRCRRMEPVFERLQRRQPRDKLLPNLNYSGYLLLSRRELAGGCGAMPRTPLWSFGGQGRKPANVAVHTKKRGRWKSAKCTPLREKRTCQPKLVRARSTGPRTLRALQQPPALGVASWSRLSDTASTP